MADSGKNAVQSHTGDGATTLFAVGFPYQEADDLQVSHDDFATLETRGVTWDVDVTGAFVEYVAPPAGATPIKIRRRTPSSPSRVTFTDGAAITKSQLDRALNQLRYYAEEREDDQ